LILGKPSSSRALPKLVLLAPNGPPADAAGARACRWLQPHPAGLPDVVQCEAAADAVRKSWTGQFQFKAERREGDRLIEEGLRPPQIGALHNVLGHWTVSNDPATIVMPTGTGKTETMLALLVAERLERVLVIVPTNALREQITGKFLTLGVLKAAGVIAAGARLPIVGTLLQRPKTVAEAGEFFRRCNVVITTAAIVGNCSDAVRRKVAEYCSHLIVDEAHHVTAPTWECIRAAFKGKPVLQFTATPYRGDGKLVDGKVVYNYPLRKAQAERYFQPIRFKAIQEYNDDKSDEKIAGAAIAQLNADLAAGRDHLMMARCSTIQRAEELYALYTKLAAAHKPVLAHSQLATSTNREAVRQLRERESRIVVCVDMFGEPRSAIYDARGGGYPRAA
jgi:superfamily II DNA or RNA helicase